MKTRSDEHVPERTDEGKSDHLKQEQDRDQSLEDSFPASDPISPSASTSVAGGGKANEKDLPREAGQRPQPSRDDRRSNLDDDSGAEDPELPAEDEDA